MINIILAVLLSFCLTVSPSAKWDCSYHPYTHQYTCDSGESDSYYMGKVDHKAHILTVVYTDGDSFAEYAATLPIK